MINWFSIVANSFWITGLALLLAGVSYYYWLAGQMGHPFRNELNNPPFQKLAMFGLLLVGIGLALTANDALQMLPAAALIFVCVIALIVLFRSRSGIPPGN